MPHLSRRKLARRIRTAALATSCLALGVLAGRFHSPAHPIPAPHLAAQQSDPYQFFDTLVDLRSQIEHNYVEPVDDSKLLQGAIDGMMSSLDPYSTYFPKDQLNDFDRAVYGQFPGIGVTLSQDPTTNAILVVSPFEDSPALKAGIYAGDRILKINGESVDGMALKDLQLKLSPPPGTQISLSILHEGDDTPVDVSVTRTVIQIHSVRGVHRIGNGNADWDFLIDEDHRIAYVRITNFMENTADELDKALLPLLHENGGLKGIILDLRFNPGGLLQAGIDVCDRFLDSGVIVSTGRPDSPKRDFVATANPEHTYPRVPLVVLVNEYSASASEIVAGALKDHNRAILIGTRTFGKGSVQSLIALDNGNSALKLTTAYYYLPSGKNIMRKKDSKTWGVEPDPAFTIPLTRDENRQVLLNRENSEIIRRAPAGATTQPTAGSTNATQPATRPVEASDRQLQRALEILIAYQAFGGNKDFTADVTTTRPSVTASVPTTTQPAPQTDSQPTPDVPQ
ncbi:MAG TPA: S41 family peptidase [Phycisphaerae bacterium]|nr:S41 family peptidase [Phycisphaerae bacterium]